MRRFSTFVLIASISLPVNAFAQSMGPSTRSSTDAFAQNLASAPSNCAARIAQGQDSAVGQLSNVKGNVLVSQGEGFALVSAPLGLRIGDRVLLSEGGQAKLVLGDKSYQLMPQSVVTITQEGNCVYAALEGTTREVYRADSTAEVYGADLPEFAPPLAEPVAMTPVAEPFPFLPVGLGLAALVGALLLINDDDDNNNPQRCERILLSDNGEGGRIFERVCTGG